VLFSDLDGDGAEELLVSYLDSGAFVRAYKLAGVPLVPTLLWTAPIGSDGVDREALTLASADVLDSPGNEVVVANNQSLFVITATGEAQTYPLDSRSASGPTLVNLDDDAMLEILISVVLKDKPPELRAYQGDGSLAWTSVSPIHASAARDSAVGDLDGDGSPEIVNGYFSYTNTGLLRVNRKDGSDFGVSLSIQDSHLAGPPILGDVDRDGKLEIVFATTNGCFSPGGHTNIHVVHPDGTPLAGWPKQVEGGCDREPTLADLDGDADLEIVYARRASGELQAHVWHHDGSDMLGWPQSTGGKTTELQVLAARTGTDEKMSLVFDSNDCMLRRRNAAGDEAAPAIEFSDAAECWMTDAAIHTVAGQRVIAVASRTFSACNPWDPFCEFLDQGIIALIPLPISSADASTTDEWPMYMGNPRRTGAVPTCRELGVPCGVTVPPCGDGVVGAREACDDGNLSGGDGCSMECKVEIGFTCAGAPSVCAKPSEPRKVAAEVIESKATFFDPNASMPTQYWAPMHPNCSSWGRASSEVLAVSSLEPLCNSGSTAFRGSTMTNMDSHFVITPPLGKVCDGWITYLENQQLSQGEGCDATLNASSDSTPSNTYYIRFFIR